jgi:hypothetical protein
MTQTKIDALMAQAGLKQLLINKANRELDRLNQKKANYEKQLDNLLELIEAAQTASSEAVEVKQ